MKINKETFEQFWKDEQKLICSYTGKGGILKDSGSISCDELKPISTEFGTIHVRLEFDLAINFHIAERMLNDKEI